MHSIPLAIAVILFVWLHRRHVKRLRNEDLNDPHKSLDFGWDPTAQSKMNGRSKSRRIGKKPEMTVTDLGTEKRPQHDRGLSMDLDMGSPYVLPPGLGGSRESLHSMTRTIHSKDDRYRPATTYTPNDGASVHSSGTRRGRQDDTSSFASSSIRKAHGDDMKQDLLGNAQRMSRSVPPIDRIPDVPEIRMPEAAAKEMPRKALPPSATTPSNGLAPSPPANNARDSYVAGDEGGLRRSNTYLARLIHKGDSTAYPLQNDNAQPIVSGTNNVNQNDTSASKDLPGLPPSALQNTKRKSPPPAIQTDTVHQQAARPPRQQSLHASAHASIEHNFLDDSSEYGDGFHVQPPSPRQSQPVQYTEDFQQPGLGDAPHENTRGLAVDEGALGYDIRRLSMGMRPLPPDDPTDNAEQRANRIRSFYKEYFDDSKKGPSNANAGAYYEDYDEGYLGDSATYYDPVAGQFITAAAPRPFAQPPGRRAMTPPPRAGGGRRHAATLSGTPRPVRGQRAFSTTSDRFGPSGRSTPKKQLPPPGPLRAIPSPHLLKEDAFSLPIDFAPPSSARDRRAGRPDSPRGGLRPYSPTVRAFTPLASSYDDLAVMPSP